MGSAIQDFREQRVNTAFAADYLASGKQSQAGERKPRLAQFNRLSVDDAAVRTSQQNNRAVRESFAPRQPSGSHHSSGQVEGRVRSGSSAAAFRTSAANLQKNKGTGIRLSTDLLDVMNVEEAGQFHPMNTIYKHQVQVGDTSSMTMK